MGLVSIISICMKFDSIGAVLIHFIVHFSFVGFFSCAPSITIPSANLLYCITSLQCYKRDTASSSSYIDLFLKSFHFFFSTVTAANIAHLFFSFSLANYFLKLLSADEQHTACQIKYIKKKLNWWLCNLIYGTACNVNEMPVFIHTLLFFSVAAALVVVAFCCYFCVCFITNQYTCDHK